MKQELRSRKRTRLQHYDYSQPGYYFVTICTQVRYENILCEIAPVGGAALGAPHSSDYSPIQISLTKAGRIVSQYLQNIDQSYKNRVRLNCYTIMPDHIHLIVQLCAPESGPPRAAAPTLPNVINTLKSLSTKSIGFSVWQRGYYDHIIRNDADLQAIRQYIENNPMKWVLDRTESNG